MTTGSSPWAAIEQEVRRCFVQEDAPEHLATLDKYLLQLEDIGGTTPNTSTAQWRELTRSIHTLKGSAGLSQLHNLSTLAHALEDVLLALGEGHLPDPALGVEILLLGVDEMQRSIKDIAATDHDCTLSPLVENIHLLLSQSVQTSATVPQPLENTAAGLIPTILKTDFHRCLERTRTALSNGQQPPGEIIQLLVQDCRTLGEILQLDWLLRAANDLEALRKLDPNEQRSRLQQEVDRLELLRQKALETYAAPAPAQPDGNSTTVTPPSPLPSSSSLSAPVPQSAPSQQSHPASTPKSVPQKAEKKAGVTTMRVPVQHLDRLANTVGDLLIQSERLALEQRRLRAAGQGLKKQTRQFYQLRERIQNCYDELLLPSARLPRFPSTPPTISVLAADTSAESESGDGAEQGMSVNRLANGLAVNGGTINALTWAGQGGEDFDPLELDRFTDLHTLLQDLQEFLARIDEYADDIELCIQSAQDSRDRLSNELDTLRENLTQARMVPFSTLADRFRRSLWDLNQRYGKQVKLLVQGGTTEIDRAVLDALYDPLLHLIRNAFDHGQESPTDRQRQGKAPQGCITLKAEHSGTRVMITVTDDGRGIDLAKVKTIAQQKGLLKSDRPRLSELLNCLFMPGFSTAHQAGELSGRGVGLDVVKGQLEQLRGSVQVQTRPGKGTRFILRVPSTLNILPLLLCQQQRSQGIPAQAAIPSSQVLEIVELSSDHMTQRSFPWRNRDIPILSLEDLLPPPRHPWQIQTAQSRSIQSTGTPSKFVAPSATSGIGIILQSTPQPITLQVDLLLEEREMVLKPLESWLPVPPYIGGCTLLPQGQVVPVLLPEALQHRSPLPNATPPPELPPAPSPHCKILVVDDSAAARRWMIHALEPLGYEVLQCRDGQEAWEQFQAGLSCNLLVCDVEMPRMDGFQLLHHLRQDDRWRNLPVAMLTSRQSDRHRQQAQHLGATGYFVKPLGIQELVRGIDQLLAP